MKFKDCLFQAYEWVQKHVSKPIQWVIYTVIFLGLLGGTAVSFRGCNRHYDFNSMNAFFINEEAPLHNDYNVTILNTSIVEYATVQNEEMSTDTIEGNILAITLCIKQVDEVKSHKLDQNDFKLKDHNGINVPLSEILGIIDVDSPDLHISQKESFFSNTSFSTTTPIKDYSWIGKKLQDGQEECITIYFSLPKYVDLEKTLMVLEIDFYLGGGKTNTGTDIILYDRTVTNE